MKFSNELTDAQIERLAILSEELGEAQQVIGKILRHGFDSWNPTVKQSPTNRWMLEKEIGDVETAVEMLCNAGDVDWTTCDEHRQRKRESIKRWLHHQGETSAAPAKQQPAPTV